MHQHAAQLQQDDTRFNGAVREVRRPQLIGTDVGTLQWWGDVGIGYFPADVEESPYDQAYFDRYARQALDPIGKQLMRYRVDFVRRHYDGFLVDVGIGCGAFIERRNEFMGGQLTYGYDVNPAGIEWLKKRSLWFDPYKGGAPALSLWDVLEHIKDFRPLLNQCMGWLFLSLPIFRDAEHVLASKHFRPSEHYWYWTRRGLISVMGEFGFELAAESDMETAAGREDIGAFAFRRG